MEELQSHFPTNVPDIDREILIRLSLKDLKHTCNVNTHLRNLCNNAFWHNKFAKDYVDLGPGIDYERVYNDVHKVATNSEKLLNYAALNNHLKLVDYVDNTFKIGILLSDISEDTAITLAKKGYLEMIKRLTGDFDNVPERVTAHRRVLEHMIINAGRNNKLDTLRYLLLLMKYDDDYLDIINAVLDNNVHHVKLVIPEHILNRPEIYLPLIFAAQRGYLDIVDVITAHYQHGNYSIAAAEAAYNNHPLVIEHLLNKKFNTKLNLALIAAMEQNNNHIIKLIISKWYRNISPDYIIRTASRLGNIQAIELLLDVDSDLINSSYKDTTPLYNAVKNGHVDATKLLIDRGANVTEFNNRALLTAVKSGYVDIVRLLIQRGADVSENRYYALISAIKKGYDQIVGILCDNISNFDDYDIGETALAEAAARDNLNMIKILLDHGVNIKYGDLAFINAAEEGKLNIIQLLIDRGINVNTLDTTALGEAAANDHIDIVQLLLDNGANIHAQDDEAIIRAAFFGKVQMIKLLMNNGANIHARDDEALVSAATTGKLDAVEFLLENGANVHAQNDKALRTAISSENIDMEELLIDYGAYIGAKPSNTKNDNKAKKSKRNK